MKNFLLVLTCCVFGIAAMNAQEESKFPKLDKSPMDAAHYPRTSAWANYMEGDDKVERQIKVLYCRPMKKERTIFGELVPYGKEWRLGANEATEVTFYQAVEIGGTVVNQGTYTMFADVNETEWTIKISTQRFIAGTKDRDKSKDIAMAKIAVNKVAKSREEFTIGFQKINDGLVHMVFAWDKTQAALPVNLNPTFLSEADKSTMDLAQYPDDSRFHNFLKPEELAANQAKVRVVYSRPKRNDRVVFGELLKYGEVWRLGANETTEITFFEPVTIGGKDVPAGTYGIIATPTKDNWEVVFHTDIPSWGTYNHDAKKNVATINLPTQKTSEMVEYLSFFYDKKSDKEVHLIIAWEETMVAVPVIFK
ncbi:MAG: hypothetical protein ACI9XO_004104 [Paraglaciecola sp.]|jgi:hypothetical protein